MKEFAGSLYRCSNLQNLVLSKCSLVDNDGLNDFSADLISRSLLGLNDITIIDLGYELT
jgi:hypothetical protein